MLWAPLHSLPTCISIYGFVHAGILSRAIKHWHFEFRHRPKMIATSKVQLFNKHHKMEDFFYPNALNSHKINPHKMCDLVTSFVSSRIIPINGVSFGNLNLGLGMCSASQSTPVDRERNINNASLFLLQECVHYSGLSSHYSTNIYFVPLTCQILFKVLVQYCPKDFPGRWKCWNSNKSYCPMWWLSTWYAVATANRTEFLMF